MIFIKKNLCLLLSTIFLTSSVVPAFATTRNIDSNTLIVSTNIEERGVVSGVIKAFKSWAKKNSSTINKAIASYIKKYPVLKGISSAIDDILEVDEDIDNAIYSAVDSLLPNVSHSTKNTIANLIRFASPF